MTKHLFLTLPEPFPGTDDVKGMRAYLYCRVAHDDGISLELQKTDLLHFAEKKGLVIVGVAVEHAGGWTLNRCALNEVSQAVCSGQVDMVLAKSCSRISRDFGKLQKYVSFLGEHGTALCCMQEQLMFRGEGLSLC